MCVYLYNMLKFVKTKGVTLFSFFFGKKKYFIKLSSINELFKKYGTKKLYFQNYVFDVLLLS